MLAPAGPSVSVGVRGGTCRSARGVLCLRLTPAEGHGSDWTPGGSALRRLGAAPLRRDRRVWKARWWFGERGVGRGGIGNRAQQATAVCFGDLVVLGLSRPHSSLSPPRPLPRLVAAEAVCPPPPLKICTAWPFTEKGCQLGPGRDEDWACFGRRSSGGVALGVRGGRDTWTVAAAASLFPVVPRPPARFSSPRRLKVRLPSWTGYAYEFRGAPAVANHR